MPLPATFVPDAPASFVPDAAPETPASFVPDVQLKKQAAPIAPPSAPVVRDPRAGTFSSGVPLQSFEESAVPLVTLPTVAEMGQALYPRSPMLGTLLQGALNQSVPLAAADELWNQAKGLPEFFSSTQGIGAAGAGAVLPALVGSVFGGVMAKQFVDQLAETIVNWGQMTGPERARASVATASPLAMLGLVAKPALKAAGEVGPKVTLPSVDIRPKIAPKVTPQAEVELPYPQEAAALGYQPGRWAILTRAQRLKVMDQLRTRGMIQEPAPAAPAPVTPPVPITPVTMEQRKEQERTVADADLAALEGMLGSELTTKIPADRAAIDTTAADATRARINEIDREIQAREPASFVAMQNARVQRNLSDEAYLQVLEEWKRRQSAQRPGAGQTERQPPAETAPPSTLLADATAPIGAEALAQTGLPHPPMRPGPGVEELKLPAIGAPAIPTGVPNAEAVRSGEGRVAEQGLLVKEREKARSDDIQRPPPGPPVEAAPEAEGPALGVSTEVRGPRTEAEVAADQVLPIDRRSTKSLMKDFGVRTYPKGPLSSASDVEIADLWSSVRAVYERQRKQAVRETGPSEVSQERGGIWNELGKRFDKEFKRRRMEHPLPPEFAKREQELRGPFQLASVDIATDPAKLGFADLQRPIDAVQMRGRIRNKVTPTEWEMVKDALPEQGRISPMEAAKLMQEAGPRVEVRTLGKEATSPEATEFFKMQHEWWDTLDRKLRNDVNEVFDPTFGWEKNLESKGGVRAELARRGWKEPDIQKAVRYDQLASSQAVREARTAPDVHWSSIAPKPESEMPGYVEIAVVKPTKRRGVQNYTREEQMNEADVQFPSTHHFPPNTLAFVRGYMEGDTFHIIEVQRDLIDKNDNTGKFYLPSHRGLGEFDTYGQAAAKLREIEPMTGIEWERMVLKAAIDHARAQGAKRVAVQDAESAMMQEGHDRALATFIDPTPHNIEVAKRYNTPLSREVLASLEKGKPFESGSNNPFERPEKHMRTADAEKAGFDVREGPSQEPGMRLHYDTILPRIMGELTGAKGEKVSFGKHKMAWEFPRERGTEREFRSEAEARAFAGEQGRVWPGSAEGIWWADKARTRTDLIFRNPDGTPKTNVTAMSFPIERAAKEFTLTGRDRPVGEHAAPPAPSAIPVEQKTHLEQMGLLDKATGAFREGRTAQDVVEEIATRPDAEKTLGKDRVVLAKWLAENMGHVLDRYTMVSEPGESGRASMNELSRKIYLSIGDNDTNPMADRFLHEAAHAAFGYQLQWPRTEVQRKAAVRINDIRSQALEHVPENVLTFYAEKIVPLIDRNATSEQWADTLNEMVSRGTFDWFPRLYALNNSSEFAAMIWRDRSGNVAQWLNTWKYRDSGMSAFKVLWNAIKEVFGAKPGTALDASLDAILSVAGERGEDVFTGHIVREGKRFIGFDTGSANMAPLAVMSATGERAAPPVPPGTAPTIKARDFRERARAFTNKLAGYAMPRLAAADVDAANAGVRYGSARIAAPLVAKYLATQVLGPHWKDGAFTRVLGDVIIEDNLRAIKQAWWEAAQKETDPVKKQEYLDISARTQSLIGQPNYALRTETQYQALLRNPEFRTAIENHRNIIQPIAESQHVETGGKLRRPGEETGAFINLMAILAPDDVEGTRSMIYGARKGDITNPLRRGSVFSKTAKGTAELYERSYRTLAERMIRGNYEQARLREFYDSLTQQDKVRAIAKDPTLTKADKVARIAAVRKNALAVEARPGVPPPKDEKGNPSRKLTIEIRGGGPGMTRQRNLWIRPDIYDEVRHAIAVDDPLAKSTALRHVAQALTEIQIVGATDAVYHTANMFGTLVSSQGAKRIWMDIARKFPGVNVLDATSRAVYHGIRAAMDSPEVQREIAQIAEVGAWRSERVHKTMVRRGAQKLLGEPGKYLDPSFYSSNWIRFIDRGGRIALNAMYDNLVGRGWVPDTPMGRREFINRMGQYNERLMPRYDSFLRESSIASFIVAGKNFNRLALQRFLLDPGAMAATPEAWWKMRAVEALGAILSVGAVAYVVNKAVTGTPWGRHGTPAGAIDTGKDDKDGRPIVIDPLQTTLWRRAFRGSGLQAYASARERGLSGKDTAKEVLTDMFNFAVHPYAGPSVRATKMAVTGYDTSGYLVSRNPEDPFENAWAALKNSNPMIASYIRGQESARIGESKSKEGWQELGRSLGAATGIGKRGKVPTFNEQVETRTGKQPDELPIRERVMVSKEIHEERLQRPNINELARRASALRNLAEGFAEEDVLRSRVAPDVRKFLDEHELRLPAFQREVTIGGAGVPLTQAEKELFEDYVVEGYNKWIKAFAPHLPKDRVHWQKALNSSLDSARAWARQRLLASMAKEGKLGNRSKP